MGTAESGHFSEPFKGKDDKWYFNLKAANNEVVLQSEGYESEQGARDGIDAATRAAVEATEGLG